MEVAGDDHVRCGVGVPQREVPYAIAGHKLLAARGTQMLSRLSLALIRRLGRGRPDCAVSTLPSTGSTALMSAELAIFHRFVLCFLVSFDDFDSSSVVSLTIP